MVLFVRYTGVRAVRASAQRTAAAALLAFFDHKRCAAGGLHDEWFKQLPRSLPPVPFDFGLLLSLLWPRLGVQE